MGWADAFGKGQDRALRAQQQERSYETAMERLYSNDAYHQAVQARMQAGIDAREREHQSSMTEKQREYDTLSAKNSAQEEDFKVKAAAARAAATTKPYEARLAAYGKDEEYAPPGTIGEVTGEIAGLPTKLTTPTMKLPAMEPSEPGGGEAFQKAPVTAGASPREESEKKIAGLFDQINAGIAANKPKPQPRAVKAPKQMGYIPEGFEPQDGVTPAEKDLGEFRHHAAGATSVNGLLDRYMRLAGTANKLGEIAGPQAQEMKTIHGTLKQELPNFWTDTKRAPSHQELEALDSILPRPSGVLGVATLDASKIAAAKTLKDSVGSRLEAQGRSIGLQRSRPGVPAPPKQLKLPLGGGPTGSKVMPSPDEARAELARRKAG